jgi:predicted nucleic acid-binding protein
MVYVDTSILVKLYFRESFSSEAARWVTRNNQSLPFTAFHELEFTNALNQKLFRKELTRDMVIEVTNRFEHHEDKGVYYRPTLDWGRVMSQSQELSRDYTPATGSRSLDIIHVASARTLGCLSFFTFDSKQEKLAEQAGLEVIRING